MPEVVINLYKQTNPITGAVIENRRITASKYGPDHDVHHITIRYQDPLPYLPGQSVGIIPPGINPKTNKPHILRLYSVASERRGDFGDGQTVSLCVARHFFDRPDTGEHHVPGIASNYLCDLKVGDEVHITGPSGKQFVLPDDFKSRDIIFTATGTGIAPYRGMLKEMFDAGYQGQTWLFLGIPHSDTILYDDEFKALGAKRGNFHYVTSISREDMNPIQEIIPTRSNKMYVQVSMYQNKEALKPILSENDSLVYLCGLKGMEDGIFLALNMIGKELGREGFVESLKKEKRLLVEVY